MYAARYSSAALVTNGEVSAMFTADSVCRPSLTPALSSWALAFFILGESFCSNSGVWSRHKSMYGTLCSMAHCTAGSRASFWLMSTPMRSKSFGTEEDPRPERSSDRERRKGEQRRGDGAGYEDRAAAVRERERLAQRGLEQRAE